MRRPPFLLAAVALGTPACTLLVDTSDLAGGPPRPDAGLLAVEAGSSVSTDAGDAGDAATDAVHDAGFSCTALSPAPTLCTTFDNGPFDPDSWDATTKLTGSITIENGTLVTQTGATGEDFRPAFVQQNFANLTALHIESDVRVDAVDPEPDTNLGARFLGIKGNGWNAMVGVVPDGTVKVSENWGGQSASHGTGTFVVGAWFRVVYDVDFTTKSYTVVINGTTISDGMPIRGPLDAATPAAVIGIYYAPVSTGSWKIAYDNVAIVAR